MERLLAVAAIRLQEVVGELERVFGSEGVELRAKVLPDSEETRYYWHWQIVEGAKNQGYYADIRRSGRWVLLSLKIPEIERKARNFVISLHAVGRAADLYAAAAFLTWPLLGGEESDRGTWHFDIVGAPHFRGPR